jgi:hypothetical protein
MFHPRVTALKIPVIIGPSGVGGWLLLFCISLTILAPLPMLMRASTGWHFIPRYLFDDLRMLYGMVVGAALWLARPISLMLLRIYFIIAAATVVLGVLNVVAIALRMHVSLFLMPGFTPALGYVGVILLWFAYFCKSARVRNTYGSNL